MVRFITAMLCVAAWSANIPAAHYHVSTSGDDGNPGTESEPFRTIQKAADVALDPGDIVTVQAGTYPERVLVKGEGGRGDPIIFEADGEVVFSGEGNVPVGFRPDEWVSGDECASGNNWITLRGFEFRDYPVFRDDIEWDDNVAVCPSNGWSIEHCQFYNFFFAVNIRGHDVTVADCRIERMRSHALVACGGRDIKIVRDTVRECNLGLENVSTSAVNKFLFTDGALVEGLISEDHVGPGWWFDAHNKNFIVRNSVIRNSRGNQYDWEGPGMWIEINQEANGKIHNNLVEGCVGSGICLMESGDIEIYNNHVRDCGNGIELRNMDGDRLPLRDLNFHDNFFESWRGGAVTTSIGNWDPGYWTPGSHNVVFDNNSYCQPDGKPLYRWVGQDKWSIDDVRAMGFEANGDLSCDVPDGLGPQEVISVSIRPESYRQRLGQSAALSVYVAEEAQAIIRYDLRGRVVGANTRVLDHRIASGQYVLRNSFNGRAHLDRPAMIQGR
jgi:hypothetical protein